MGLRPFSDSFIVLWSRTSQNYALEITRLAF